PSLLTVNMGNAKALTSYIYNFLLVYRLISS
ncbi:MAG: hypothetical protein ACI9O3_001536, partial [Colwellia sp.]